MILECENLSKNYGGLRALDELNFKLESGKIVGLLGPNGHGKTTLIKILSGLLRQDKGTVLIDGKKVGMETKKIVSYLPERSYLSPGMKIRDVAKFFEEFYEDFDIKRANAMIDELGLDRESRLKSLSKGNREKVQLIMVMSRKAKLYLLDEPENSLSPKNQIMLKYFIEDCVRNHDCQFIISTHSPFILSLRWAKIYDIDSSPVIQKRWTELEGVRVYSDFFFDHMNEFER